MIASPTQYILEKKRMVPRLLGERIAQMARWFPVVSVTGPRQSGKSTIVKSVFPDYQYVNLENPQTRKEALDDPVGFINNRNEHLIIDEVQYAPDLFSMIQVASDERSSTGQYVLSGSQNFRLLKNITQSLAGRVGLVELLPFSFQEARIAQTNLSADDFMISGGYPRLFETHMPTDVFFSNYVSTYVERDVADYLDVRNLTSFQKFLRLCALNSGNLMNYAKLAKDADINAQTAKTWLSMLNSSYITFQLAPYFSNEGKRLIKTPKMYFHDTGLLCYLLGITNRQQLLFSPHLGAIFENLIVAETLKNHIDNGEEPKLFFYRDDSKIEVDLLDFTNASAPMLIEIKSGQTYKDNFARHLSTVGEFLGIPEQQRHVVLRIEQGFQAKGAVAHSAAEWLLRQT